MMTRFVPLLCAALGLLAAGCTPSTSEWSSAAAPKTPRVQYTRLHHEAAFKPGSSELAAGEAAQLRRFFDQAAVTSEDHVYFEPAIEDRLTAARIGRLTKLVDAHGIGAKTLPAAEGALAHDSVNIVVERYVVVPPDCPNWTSPSVGDHSNQPGSNFGCSDATNLGLMVADPRDLLMGRTLGPAEGDAALAAVKRYREGKPKDPTPSSASTVYMPQPAGGGGGGGDGGSPGGAGGNGGQ
jgi:pilus assembly protein CpaD